MTTSIFPLITLSLLLSRPPEISREEPWNRPTVETQLSALKTHHDIAMNAIRNLK